MRRVNNPEYIPAPLPADDDDTNLVSLDLKIMTMVKAVSEDREAAVYFTNLDWVALSYEFVRGGADRDDVGGDHLLGFDSETGGWHAIDENVKDRVALDYSVRYTDIIIQTNLVLEDEAGD
jgi:hypothetical protein